MSLLPKIVVSLAMILYCGCAVVVGENMHETNGKVAICHKGKTIYVDEAAVKAHLGHGDYMEVCR
jgi:hypothetical protein